MKSDWFDERTWKRRFHGPHVTRWRLTMIRLTYLVLPLAMLSGVVGCGEKPQEPAQDTSGTPAANADPGEEGHSHEDGPNGGTIADWGGGTLHVEFTVDHDTQEATVYVLGDDAKSPAPVKSDNLLLSISEPPFQVELMPAPLDGEGDGASSRFVARHESLGIVQEFAGTISGVVDGTPYTGDFKEEDHSHQE